MSDRLAWRDDEPGPVVTPPGQAPPAADPGTPPAAVAAALVEAEAAGDAEAAKDLQILSRGLAAWQAASQAPPSK